MAAPIYDPRNVIVTYGGQILTGFADDTFIEIDIPDLGFEGKVGAYGEGGRVKKNNGMGTVKLTMLQWSTSNDVLSLGFNADMLSYTGAKELRIQDLLGTSLFHTPGAYVKKWPTKSYSTAHEALEWELEFLRVSAMHVGQSQQL